MHGSLEDPLVSSLLFGGEHGYPLSFLAPNDGIETREYLGKMKVKLAKANQTRGFTCNPLKLIICLLMNRKRMQCLNLHEKEEDFIKMEILFCFVKVNSIGKHRNGILTHTM